MTLDSAAIRALIEKAFPDADIVVEELGDGTHLGVRVISRAFEGRNRAEQQQMVLDALHSEGDKNLPSLALQTSID